MSTKYKLRFLPLFQTDLEKIVNYIAHRLKNPQAAHKLVNDVEKAILKRLDNPLIGLPFPSNKPRKIPYYRINIRNFSVFYVVYDDIMEVRRILYSKRNIQSIL